MTKEYNLKFFDMKQAKESSNLKDKLVQMAKLKPPNKVQASHKAGTDLEHDNKIALLSKQYNNVDKILLAHQVPKEDREDLLQEIFITALKSLDQLEDPAKIGSWIWSIAEHATKRYFRKTWIKTRSECSCFSDDGRNTMEMTTDPHASEAIESVADTITNREQLRNALNQLSRSEVALLNLHYGMQYKLSEIAEAQNKNYSTIKSMHTRALRKLRRILKELEEENQ